ncbi:hypothetical protein BKA18_005770 [Streptomyces auratus]
MTSIQYRMRVKPTAHGARKDPEDGEQAVLAEVFDMERRKSEEGGVAEGGSADDARGDAGEDGCAESLDAERAVPSGERQLRPRPRGRGVR